MSIITLPYQFLFGDGDISRKQERLIPLYIFLAVLGILLVILYCVYIVANNVLGETNALLEKNSIFVLRGRVKINVPHWDEWQLGNYMQR